MEQVGLLKNVTSKMHLAQASGCSPIVQAYKNNEKQVAPVKPDTIVKSVLDFNSSSFPKTINLELID